MNPHSQTVDRGEAVNLARGIMGDNPMNLATITPRGVLLLAQAVLKMDEALSAGPTERQDPLAQWGGRHPSAEEIEAHYRSSQHQEDECEMCRFIHDAAKAYLSAATPERST